MRKNKIRSQTCSSERNVLITPSITKFTRRVHMTTTSSPPGPSNLMSQPWEDDENFQQQTHSMDSGFSGLMSSSEQARDDSALKNLPSDFSFLMADMMMDWDSFLSYQADDEDQVSIIKETTKEKHKGVNFSTSTSGNTTASCRNTSMNAFVTTHKHGLMETPVSKRVAMKPTLRSKRAPFTDITNTHSISPISHRSKPIQRKKFLAGSYSSTVSVLSESPENCEETTALTSSTLKSSLHVEKSTTIKSSSYCFDSLVRTRSESAIQDINSSPELLEHYTLTGVSRPQVPHKAFRSISGETLVGLLSELTTEKFNEKYFLIDCRYPYEYNGGHIRNAINIYDVSRVKEIFYPSESERFNAVNKKIPIFYCEFSQVRGPKMAMELRRQDRHRNETIYPKIDYKEIYLLDCGYRSFYSNYPSFCEPNGGYVEMIDPKFKDEMKKFKSHHSKTIKKAIAPCIRKRKTASLAINSTYSSQITSPSIIVEEDDDGLIELGAFITDSDYNAHPLFSRSNSSMAALRYPGSSID